MSKNPHTAFALANFSLSGASGLYNSARPNYPIQAINQIINELKSTTNSNKSKIVELGAGTGLFTRMLLEQAPLGKIESILCIEPSSGMRQGFQKSLKEMTRESRGDIECKIIDGAFDQIAAKDGVIDMVIAAQAFHWIGKDGTSAIEEIARVLKPGGKLVLIWNLEDRKTEWVGKLRDAYEEFEENTPQYRHGYWKHIFSLPAYTSSFTLATETNFNRALKTTSQMVYDRVLSKSFITAQNENVQKEIVERLKVIVEEGKGKVWIDEKEGTFEYPYTTDLFIMTRK